MKPKTLREAGTKAAIDAAVYMSNDLRTSAFDHGWDYDVASNIEVLYDGSAYQVHVQAEFEAQAMDYEYGTTVQRPTAVFRKYGNNTDKAERVFVSSFEKQTGWKA